jgi:carbon-monoxide dehydrogenase large subunit
MNAIGSWKLMLSTPRGPQEIQLNINTQDDGFTGRIESRMFNQDIAGSVADDKLDWVMEVTKPLPMKVAFEVVVDGDAMRGTAKLGMFGKSDLSGERI